VNAACGLRAACGLARQRNTKSGGDLASCFLLMGARLFKLTKRALRPRPLLAVACAMALGCILWLILPPRLLSIVDCEPSRPVSLWPDGERMASRGMEGREYHIARREEDLVTVLEMPSGRVRGTFMVPKPDYFEAFDISQDGHRLLRQNIPSFGGVHLTLVDVGGGTLTKIEWVNRLTLVAASMSPDGRYLAVCEEGELARPAWLAWFLPRVDASFRCRVVDIDSGREIAQLPGGTILVFSDDSSQLAIGDDESGKIRIWDLRTDWMRTVANAAIAGLFVCLLLGWLRAKPRRHPPGDRVASVSAAAIS
jgi:hypothetical protein